MPTVKVPLFTDVYSNVDSTVLNDKAFRRLNGYIDQLGGLNVRHGQTSNYEIGSRVDGLYYWPDNKVIALSGKTVSLFNVDNWKNIQLFSSNVASDLIKGSNATFCNDANYTYIANGGKIVYVNPAGTVATITDPDAPTVVTHIAYLDSYILANGTDNRFYWSDVLAGTSWDSLSFAQAAGNPDKILALKVFQRQIYLFGSASVEVWQNEGESPFSRVEGGFQEVGCIARYSVATLDDSLMWLSDKRYFVELKGGRVKRVPCPFDTTIQSMSNIADCLSTRLEIDSRTYIVFQFPSGNKTYAYQPATEESAASWEEWATWSTTKGIWQAYDITCSCFESISQQSFVGTERINSIIKPITKGRTDFIKGTTTSVRSTSVRFFTQTGWIDYGTSKNKRCKELRFRVRRGDPYGEQYVGTDQYDTYNPPPHKMILRWRDDGNQEWTGYEEILLGELGDNEHIVNIPRTGIFKTRQWEFSTSARVAIVLSDAEQDFEVLSR